MKYITRVIATYIITDNLKKLTAHYSNIFYRLQMMYPGIVTAQILTIDMDLTGNRIIILNKLHEKHINTMKINQTNLKTTTIISITINTGNNSILLIQMIRGKRKNYLMYEMLPNYKKTYCVL